MYLSLYLVSLSLAVAPLTFAAPPATCPTGHSFCGVSNVESPGKNTYCNVTGHLVRPVVLQQGCSMASLTQCRDACLSNNDCRSFGYTTSGVCTLYSDQISQMGFQSQPGAPRSFSDKKCFNNPTCLHSPGGKAFCSNYLSIPVKTITSTITTTSTDVSTVTSTSTATITPDPITSIVNATTTADPTTTTLTFTDSATTTTVTQTITESPTTTSTVSTTTFSATQISCQSTATVLTAVQDNSGASKRDHIERRQTTNPTPYCVTKVSPTAVSTACSCLSIRPSSTRVLSTTTETVSSTTIITTSTTTTLDPDTTTITDSFTTTPTSTVSTTTTIISTVSQTTTTTLSTVTTTTTQTFSQPTPAVFNGLNYYAYTNNYNCSVNPPQPPFNATTWNNPNYAASGQITNLNTITTPNWPSQQNTSCLLPGQPQAQDCSQLTLVNQGFFFAPVSGSYSIAVTGAIDNFGYVWTGQSAYSNYTNGNADSYVLRASNYIGGFGHNQYSLVAGQFLPITIIYANGGGAGRLTMAITSPNGTSTINTSGFFVPPCDGSPFSP